MIVRLVFGLQVHMRRQGAVVEVLWPMDRAVDGGEGQPGPELGPGGRFLGLRHKTKEADGG